MDVHIPQEKVATAANSFFCLLFWRFWKWWEIILYRCAWYINSSLKLKYTCLCFLRTSSTPSTTSATMSPWYQTQKRKTIRCLCAKKLLKYSFRISCQKSNYYNDILFIFHLWTNKKKKAGVNPHTYMCTVSERTRPTNWRFYVLHVDLLLTCHLTDSTWLVVILLYVPRSIAKELADWLIHNNVVEHIFGPNLHIEVRMFVLVRTQTF